MSKTLSAWSTTRRWRSSLTSSSAMPLPERRADTEGPRLSAEAPSQARGRREGMLELVCRRILKACCSQPCSGGRPALMAAPN